MRKLRITQNFTNREEKSVERYFLDIDKYKPLTHEEEVICAQKIRAGDLKSLEKLTKANLRFVVSVAKQYQYSSIPLPDLINSGNEGLVTAAYKFDESKGFKFISYAVWWIRQSIIKSIQDNAKPVRFSSNKTLLLAKYKKVEDAYLQVHGELPSIDYVSKIMEIDEESAEEIMNLNKVKFSSLDTGLNQGEETTETQADILPDNDSLKNLQRNIMQDSLRKDLLDCISKLTEKEKFILIKLFNLDGKGEETLEEIGKKLNLSKERIRQIRDNAISRASSIKNREILLNYL
jgi:RNA polymerase primary sigma factor